MNTVERVTKAILEAAGKSTAQWESNSHIGKAAIDSLYSEFTRVHNDAVKNACFTVVHNQSEWGVELSVLTPIANAVCSALLKPLESIPETPHCTFLDTEFSISDSSKLTAVLNALEIPSEHQTPAALAAQCSIIRNQAKMGAFLITCEPMDRKRSVLCLELMDSSWAKGIQLLQEVETSTAANTLLEKTDTLVKESAHRLLSALNVSEVKGGK